MKLPRLIAAELDGGWPAVVLERLPGTDLGRVVGSLDEDQFDGIAQAIAAQQRIVAKLPDRGRYGYAASAEKAPYERWSAAVERMLERSRGRMLAAGVFDPAVLGAAAALVDSLRPDLDRQPVTPFLHGTTTKNVIRRGRHLVRDRRRR